MTQQSNYKLTELSILNFKKPHAERAADLGYKALALTDRDGLYGVIPFYQKCQQLALRAIIGAQITMDPGDQIVLLCENICGYHHLSRLITRGRLNHPKGESSVSQKDLGELAEGLICLIGGKEGKLGRLLDAGQAKAARSHVRQSLGIFGSENLYIELTHNLEQGDQNRCEQLYRLARKQRLTCVATNGVHYAKPEQGRLHDVLRCIKGRVTLDSSHGLRHQNHQRYLKSAAEMGRLFGEIPDVLLGSQIIAERCHVQLDFSRYRFPDFPVPEGHTADAYLTELCWARLSQKYRSAAPAVRNRLAEELSLIKRLGLSGYFLMVWDIVEFAKSKGIPVQGRGSAANSLAAYLLGITPVDAIRHNLFFGRFLNEDQTTIPDIDLDLAASRQESLADREDVIQYVYRRYGEEYVAMVPTFITFQNKSAIREVGRVFDIPQRLIDRMARLVEGRLTDATFQTLEQTPPFRPYLETPRWRHFKEQAVQIIGIPRHLSIHTGGMVITSCPMPDLVPLEPARMPGRIVCQWDKDMVEAAGLIKVDLLGLGMLAVVRETLDWVNAGHRIPIQLDEIPPDDPDVYRMLARGETIGAFQVESRVQIQSLPRTEPANLSELAVQVAMIRPGPIQSLPRSIGGNMVEPYIRRKQGLEPVRYPHPKLEPILSETLGVILFQEQVLQVAVEIAGYTPGEAESLRRALGKSSSPKTRQTLKDTFIARAERNGVSQGDGVRIFACRDFSKSSNLEVKIP